MQVVLESESVELSETSRGALVGDGCQRLQVEIRNIERLVWGSCMQSTSIPVGHFDSWIQPGTAGEKELHIVGVDVI